MLFHKYTKKYYFYEVKSKRGKKIVRFSQSKGKETHLLHVLSCNDKRFIPIVKCLIKLETKTFIFSIFLQSFEQNEHEEAIEDRIDAREDWLWISLPKEDSFLSTLLVGSKRKRRNKGKERLQTKQGQG